MSDITERAVFGGGCFWCTEAIFSRLRGVKSVTSGYAGGHTADPSYEEVCSGNTGHAEVVSVEFDPQIISYDQLLEVFLHTHNPTTPNRQGNDKGTQYRSIILTTSDEQVEQAQRAIGAFNAEKVFDELAVTEVKPLEGFYPAEDYHERYYERNGEAPYCQVVINPKLAKFREKYAELIKSSD
jgi:peptide-methionine (S)-S-oxide reductase